MKCALCVYWTGRLEGDDLGECRGAPPVNIDDLGAALFPRTKPDQYCAKFQPITLNGGPLGKLQQLPQTVAVGGHFIDLKG